MKTEKAAKEEFGKALEEFKAAQKPITDAIRKCSILNAIMRDFVNRVTGKAGK